MARRGAGGPQRPVKGFRPGKEPPELRKRHMKQQLGDAGAGQQRLVEFFAARSPAESRALLRAWRIGLLAGGVALAVAGALAWGWSGIAGGVLLVLAAVALFLWWQLRRQRAALEALADQVGGPSRGRRSGG